MADENTTETTEITLDSPVIELTGAVAVKAITDGPEWALDVLAAPFDSRDSDGQWFDARTDYMLDHFKTPVPVYYHSLKKGGGFADKPEVLGNTVSLSVQPDGIH